MHSRDDDDADDENGMLNIYRFSPSEIRRDYFHKYVNEEMKDRINFHVLTREIIMHFHYCLGKEFSFLIYRLAVMMISVWIHLRKSLTNE